MSYERPPKQQERGGRADGRPQKTADASVAAASGPAHARRDEASRPSPVAASRIEARPAALSLTNRLAFPSQNRHTSKRRSSCKGRRQRPRGAKTRSGQPLEPGAARSKTKSSATMSTGPPSARLGALGHAEGVVFYVRAGYPKVAVAPLEWRHGSFSEVWTDRLVGPRRTARDKAKSRGEPAMPYVNCPECGIRSFALAPWSTVDRCPTCEAPLSVPRQSVTEDLHRRPYWRQGRRVGGPKAPPGEARGAR